MEEQYGIDKKDLKNLKIVTEKDLKEQVIENVVGQQPRVPKTTETKPDQTTG